MAPGVAPEPLGTAVFVLAAAVLLLLLLVLAERTFALLQRSRSARQEALLTPRICRAVEDGAGPAALGRLSRSDRRVARSVLLRLAPDLRGESGQVIAALYQGLGFLECDLVRLRSWRATVRARAAADLGLIRAPESVPALSRMLDDPSVRVRQSVVWALGQAGNPGTLLGLVPLLGDPSRLVARRVEEVLAERGREIPEAILGYAEKAPIGAGRIAAIELLGWLRIAEAAGLLLQFMTDLDPEIRVKSVKAAAAIGDPRFLEPFHRLLEDPRWEVRCQAAKGLSLFGSAVSVPRLELTLRDDQWWVRLYAATALAETGAPGEEALRRALDDSEPKVRGMARYLLERGDAVPALP
jgi:hypothetical protein